MAAMAADRLNVDHQVMGGVACIAGTRIPVATVVAMVADRMTDDEIITAFPQLDAETIRQSLLYAAEALREREQPLLSA
jgi:uncharacterized protein (DUF433 family)